MKRSISFPATSFCFGVTAHISGASVSKSSVVSLCLLNIPQFQNAALLEMAQVCFNQLFATDRSHLHVPLRYLREQMLKIAVLSYQAKTVSLPVSPGTDNSCVTSHCRCLVTRDHTSVRFRPAHLANNNTRTLSAVLILQRFVVSPA